MAERIFTGPGGSTISAIELGSRHEPSVMMLYEAGQLTDQWRSTAEALVEAGRHIVLLDLAHQDYMNAVSTCTEVLRQLPSRPVLIGAGAAGFVAAIALGEGGPDLASGLVLVDGPSDASASGDNTHMVRHAGKAAARIDLPILHIRGNGQRGWVALESISPENAEIVTFGLQRFDQGDFGETLDTILIEFLERQVPRAPTEYVAGSDPRTLRDALGTFATGVTVVTACGPAGERVGLTANSFTSVSLDPPLLLVCPARSAGSTELLSSAEYFGINVLHIGQQGVSILFATKGEDRFAETDCETWDHNVPIIRNSLASFECRKYAEYDGGDHVILVGEVLRVRYAPQRDPLLYFRGRYRRLHFG